MTTFKINERAEIVCEWKKTRMAFKHVATLVIDGREADTTKICYQNRTWERYEYESVLHKLIGETKAFDAWRKIAAIKAVDRIGAGSVSRTLKTVAMVAKLGDVFGKTIEEKNTWKARMLKAGLQDKGLSMPEDWDSLDEQTKQARLNGAIENLLTSREIKENTV